MGCLFDCFVCCFVFGGCLIALELWCCCVVWCLGFLFGRLGGLFGCVDCGVDVLLLIVL